MSSLLGGFSKALDVVKSDLNEFVTTVQEEASQQISGTEQAPTQPPATSRASPAEGEGTGMTAAAIGTAAARESALGAPSRSSSVLGGIDVGVDDEEDIGWGGGDDDDGDDDDGAGGSDEQQVELKHAPQTSVMDHDPAAGGLTEADAKRRCDEAVANAVLACQRDAREHLTKTVEELKAKHASEIEALRQQIAVLTEQVKMSSIPAPHPPALSTPKDATPATEEPSASSSVVPAESALKVGETGDDDDGGDDWGEWD